MTVPGTEVLDLLLPRELADIDPDAVRRRAASHREESDACRAQGARLRRAVVRLVPVVWLGLGSLSFATTALQQAATLDTVATAAETLAKGLDELATTLAWARDEAVAAVRAGARLDAEIRADARRLATFPGPARPDLDPGVLHHRAESAARLRERWLVAQDTAHRAWDRASATFDSVSYAMPDLEGRMNPSAVDDWRPAGALAALPVAEWRTLVGLPPACTGGGYTGGGVLTGPDGRRYPLVARPVGDGMRASDDGPPAGTDGADPGWRRIGVRVGIDRFGPGATTATKGAIVTAALLGVVPHTIGRLRPELLPGLLVDDDGRAHLPPEPPAPHQARTGGTGQVTRSALTADDEGRLRWVPDTSTDSALGRPAASRTPVTVSRTKAVPVGPNALALVGSGLGGLDTAQRLDDSRTAGYRVVFEEHADGRTRARLTLYQVRSDETGTQVISRGVHVDPDGGLR